MASPTVVARTEDVNTTASTTLDIAFTQTTGDLVIIFISTAQSTALSSIGDGFNDLTSVTGNFHILWKILDGSEGGNVTMTVTSTKFCSIAYNIQGHSTSSAPEFSTVATGTSTSPNPGTLTPSGGTKDYLWLAAIHTEGEFGDDDAWCSAAPTDFTNLTQKSTGTAGNAPTNCCVASANYASTASSMDPSAFTISGSRTWTAYTVAVYPGGATVATGRADESDTSLAVGRSKLFAISLSAETDTSLALSRAKQFVVNLSTESDTALALGLSKKLTTGLSLETDTALAVTWDTGTEIPVGRADETDAALSLAITKRTAVGVSTETDTALSLAIGRALVVGVAIETDTALALSVRKLRSVGVASETDTALALSWQSPTTPTPPDSESSRIKLRRSTIAAATKRNEVLLHGEILIDKQTGEYVVGDGLRTWAQLRNRRQQLFPDTKTIAAMRAYNYENLSGGM